MNNFIIRLDTIWIFDWITKSYRCCENYKVQNKDYNLSTSNLHLLLYQYKLCLEILLGNRFVLSGFKSTNEYNEMEHR